MSEVSLRDAGSAPLRNGGGARPLRVALYVLTALSAVAALFVEPALAGAVQRGAVSPLWMFVPLAMFCALFLGYAVDRWRLVGRQKYPASRAIVQSLFGLILASVLLSSAVSDWGRLPQGSDRLLAHPDAEIRASAVYALGFHGKSASAAALVAARLEDRSPEVRQAALDVLRRWSGQPNADVPGVRAWASALSRSSTVTEEGTHP
jgi:hypothetical protein